MNNTHPTTAAGAQAAPAQPRRRMTVTLRGGPHICEAEYELRQGPEARTIILTGKVTGPSLNPVLGEIVRILQEEAGGICTGVAFEMELDPTGTTLIATERARQIVQIGFDDAHDELNNEGQLLEAARAYLTDQARRDLIPLHDLGTPPEWPWNRESFNPSADGITNLVKAGALCAAEVDRRNRIRASILRKGGQS